MPKYIKVKVDLNRRSIKLLGPVAEANLALELARLGSQEQIWEVSSLEDVVVDIESKGGLFQNRLPSPITDALGSKADPGEIPRAMVAPKRATQSWDWSKVSDSDKSKLIQHYQNKEWKEIMKIHNDLNLSSEVYCCTGYIPKIKENIEKAKADGELEF